jgi:hypothetical protein
MAELTGPSNCAECGTETPLETVRNGDAGALVLATPTGMVEVPGLYVCTGCAGAIMVGEKAPTVTPERAVAFLADEYLPRLAMSLSMSYNRFIDCKEAVEALDPTVEVGLGIIDLG